MKKVFTILVVASESVRFEKTLNQFQIGLNDWDKTRVLNVNETQLINYTIICEESIFTSIVETIYGTRVY